MVKNAIIMKTGFSRSQPTNWGFYKLIFIYEDGKVEDANFQGPCPISSDIIDILKLKPYKISVSKLGCNHGKIEGLHEQRALKYALSKEEIIEWIKNNFK